MICTHFHDDCLGGIKAFHNLDIPSYGYKLTIDLAKEQGLIPPQNSFENSLLLQVGELRVSNYFLGGGHTKDNIVSYIPAEKILFGGCLVKSLGASKGNLIDADTTQWPITVSTVAKRFQKARIIIPGHGLEGDTYLLNYTINLFKNN